MRVKILDIPTTLTDFSSEQAWVMDMINSILIEVLGNSAENERTFSHFCTRAVSSNPIKTCRDVGFRKSYAEKIKADPVWLIYTRAYKQHYARFMKKTMSKTEFAQWAEYALDLRQKALDGEIGIEEYTELIRK